MTGRLIRLFAPLSRLWPTGYASSTGGCSRSNPNPIYPAMLCMAIGGMVSAICRPDLKVKGLVGGAVFLGLYALFMLGLVWFTPGYIPQVWNLAALSGVLVGGIPPEELFFGFAFGWYWTGVYEHFTWRTSVTLA